MHIKTKLLLTLAAVAALFAVTPVVAQEVKPDPYPLEIACTADEVFVGNGVVGMPIALAFGVKEATIPLPDAAILRLEPVVFTVVGAFNIHGQFSLPIHVASEPPPTPDIAFFMQAFSWEFDWGKICTSQLVGVGVTPGNQWRFVYLG